MRLSVRPVIKDPDKKAFMSLMSTYDNLSNLAPTFRDAVLSKYEGTRLGKQELEGLDIDDVEGALWNREMLDETRVQKAPDDFSRIVIAIDPAVTSNQDSDETGIVAYGRVNGDCYCLEDASGIYTPKRWGRKSVGLYYKWKADILIGEANNGGDLVESNIRTVDKNVNFKKVWASRGKIVRAEPCAAIMEQGRDHHIGTFPEMEDQLCSYDGSNKSPDRLDAKVWAITELMLGEETGFKIW